MFREEGAVLRAGEEGPAKPLCETDGRRQTAIDKVVKGARHQYGRNSPDRSGPVWAYMGALSHGNAPTHEGIIGVHIHPR